MANLLAKSVFAVVVMVGGCGRSPLGTFADGGEVDIATDGADDATAGAGAEMGERAAPPPACAEWAFDMFVAEEGPTSVANITTTAEGLILAGTPAGNGIRTLGYDGTLLWEYPTLGEGNWILDVVQLADGSLIHAGQSTWSGELRMARIDRNPDDGDDGWFWAMAAGDRGVQRPIDLRMHPEGGVLVSAFADSETAGPAMWTMHVDERGNVVWSDVAELPKSSVEQRGGMDTFDVGDMVQLARGEDGFRISRASPDGQRQWDEERTQLLMPRDVVVGPDGDIFVVADASIVRLRGYGDVAWERRYEGGQGANLQSAVWDADLQVLIAAGDTRGFADSPLEGKRPWAVVLDADGEPLWTHVEERLLPGSVVDMEIDPTAYRAFAAFGYSGGMHIATISLVPCR